MRAESSNELGDKLKDIAKFNKVYVALKNVYARQLWH